MSDSRPTPESAAESLSEKLRALGNAITPASIGGTAALMVPLHARIDNSGIKVTRDLRYGPADRNRLDVFEPATGDGAKRPVLVFVHGGGFVMGDKTAPNSPFYDNVGYWAARNGMVGVNITYRLAPQHGWPAGSDDVALAVKWVRENIAAHGGDMSRVYVMGQSAGGVHVAGYIAREFGNLGGRAPSSGWKPAGALLISGLYDIDTMDREERFRAYFGDDDSTLENASFVAALAGAGVPLFVVLAELDPPDFVRQFVVLLETHVRRQVPMPRFVQLMAHNHFTTTWRMNTSDDTLGPAIRGFVEETSGQSGSPKRPT
ncbi:MAG: alpha/beta hydrolase [Gammaproteobacteria bacterium]